MVNFGLRDFFMVKTPIPRTTYAVVGFIFDPLRKADAWTILTEHLFSRFGLLDALAL
jgi:hypothetical protein